MGKKKEIKGDEIPQWGNQLWGYLPMDVKCHWLAEKMKGALSFLPSTMTARSDSESERWLLLWGKSSTVNPSSLPQPRSGDSKEAAFWYEDYTGQHLSGRQRDQTPHTAHRASLYGALKPGVLVPRRKGLTLVQPTLLISGAAHSRNLTTPDRPKSPHWSKKFSAPQLFTHFPFLLPLLPGPSQGELRAPLATNWDWNVTSSEASDFGRSNANSGVFNPVPERF